MSIPHALGWFWTGVAILAALVVGYTILTRRLAELVQPFRLELADRGAALLQSDLDEADKQVVRFMVSHPFSLWPATVLVVYLPIEVMRQVLIKLVTRRPITTGIPNAECGVLARLFLYSILAANPIAGAILVAELQTIGFIGFLVGGHALLLKAFFATQRAEALGVFARSQQEAAA